jgi:hypothetical protein
MTHHFLGVRPDLPPIQEITEANLYSTGPAFIVCGTSERAAAPCARAARGEGDEP